MIDVLSSGQTPVHTWDCLRTVARGERGEGERKKIVRERREIGRFGGDLTIVISAYIIVIMMIIIIIRNLL